MGTDRKLSQQTQEIQSQIDPLDALGNLRIGEEIAGQIIDPASREIYVEYLVKALLTQNQKRESE